MSGVGEPSTETPPTEKGEEGSVTGGMFAPQVGKEMPGFESLQLYQTWRKRMESENDFIVCIAASSQTEMSGTGKSTLAVQLGRAFDNSGTPFKAAEQASLDADKVSKQFYPDLPKGSAIIFDEAQGTLGSDGVDNRRSMADAVVKMSRSAAQYRWKQMTLIIVTQSTGWIDSRMMELIDRLILIQEKNHQQKWARAVVFDHYFDDLSSTKQEYTPAIEDLYWRPLPDDDEDYHALHKMKQDSDGRGDSGGEDDEEEEDPVEPWVKFAHDLNRNQGISFEDIAAMDTFEYTGEWIRRQVKEYERELED